MEPLQIQNFVVELDGSQDLDIWNPFASIINSYVLKFTISVKNDNGYNFLLTSQIIVSTLTVFAYRPIPLGQNTSKKR